MAQKAEVQANTAKEQAIAAQKLPGLREAEAASAAVLQRLQIAKGQLEEEVNRLEERRQELQGRFAQLAGDLEREEQIVEDNKLTIKNLDDEQAELEEASRRVGEVEAKSKEELDNATKALGISEAAFSDLTVRLADENARRTQLQRALEEAQARKDRIQDQLKTVEGDLAGVLEQISSMEGPAAKQAEVDRLEEKLSKLEATLLVSEDATAKARSDEQQARKPLEEAEGNLRELETEARTLRQILNRVDNDLFPAVVERITIEPGYEAALGAALGEDLDVSVEESASVHWGITGDGSEDPVSP